MANDEETLGFVVCVSDTDCLKRYLFASDCLQRKKYRQAIYLGVPSAAAAFNPEMDKTFQPEWLVWVHQDVVLPVDWDLNFKARLSEAIHIFPRLAVVGVYGIDNITSPPRRAGRVLDRGCKSAEPAELPCLVDSLDEMLVAVRTDSGLRFDPALGFDFYATDIALTAVAQGMEVAVVDASCEHWSATRHSGNPESLARRIAASGERFERKWRHRFPLQTPCFYVTEIGDVARQCQEQQA